MNPQIPQFQISTHPFKFNDNYDLNASGEANTYNQIYAEGAYLFGSDVVFIPRTPNNAEPIFGEYLASTIEAGYPMRLFVEDVTNWSGNGDMYSKFGLQITDEVTFHCPKITFTNAFNENRVKQMTIGKFIISNSEAQYPKQGDLIYYVKGKKLFEIQHIEDEAQPGFYVFGNRNSYIIKCKTYTFDHMEIMNDRDSIPAEVSSLNNLAKQDEEHFNDKVINTVVTQTILDNTEIDPILGR